MEEDLKTVEVIMNLPVDKKCLWMCYNDDQKVYYERLIREARGSEYFDKYVTLLATKEGKVHNNPADNIYMAPELHRLRGNGYN
tara:strand:+ start:162 stop:413 length:252 start_codon:yes stop_codon:yes gene_type:complete